MHRKIEEIEFTIFDTETTGLEPQSGDKIIEIAAVKLKGDKKIGSFETFVNPRRPVSPGAFAVNKISQEMLLDAPDILEVLPEFLDFVGDSCLCSYNAAFDMGFLENEPNFFKADKLDKIIVVDVLKMARRLLPGMERYALWFVAQKLGINVKQEHRAMSDVELTIGVFLKLVEILKQKYILDYKNFVNLFGINKHCLDNLNNAKIVQIQEALDLKAKIKIRYISASSAEVTERQIMPKELKKDKDSIYLIGFCFLKNEDRFFRIDSILHLELV